jgi:hypothetical protein
MSRLHVLTTAMGSRSTSVEFFLLCFSSPLRGRFAATPFRKRLLVEATTRLKTRYDQA